MTSPALRLVPGQGRTGDRAPSRGDLGLAGVLFATHALWVIAFAAGWLRQEGVAGYATAVALLSGRELVRELRLVLLAAAGARR